MTWPLFLSLSLFRSSSPVSLHRTQAMAACYADSVVVVMLALNAASITCAGPYLAHHPGIGNDRYAVLVGEISTDWLPCGRKP